ncbi:NAD(P)H:quinone oxidoreductase [Vibrio hippocampi]|uniref:NAD(P)H dehydrogenase (Quinone) n=1 Tax=Vibrio hippocampi TaxID=654686 RepID=A0ABN8DDE2_9VIBR|nr:NAD(P)H:quinone oxidoreductase [Vibrio hippocampi]CAH0524979.1 NAD(P)H dehydrogenase (quinone) [Vibrio hippocampi]
MSPCRVLVLYYSRHGSTQQLARAIARGVESVEGCQAMLRTVPEIALADKVVAEKEVAEGETRRTSSDDACVTLDELKQCDGLAMGSPVWFGNMAAPLKHFWDQTTTLWVSGDLIDKPACVFTSSSSLHGGQESVQQSLLLPLLHHGMLIMGIPYSEPELHHTHSGGTPYGASHVATAEQGSALTAEEKRLAQALGARLANTALKLRQTTIKGDR